MRAPSRSPRCSRGFVSRDPKGSVRLFMRVAVDARQGYRAKRRGIGRTLVHLVRALAAARPAWDFRLFHQDAAADDPFVGLPNVTRRRVRMPGDRFDLWER